MRDFDLVVLGAGAAGLTAAREARRLGADVAIVHDGPLGGECTWTGCVPSKALLHAASGHCSFTDAMTAVHDAIRRVAATEDAKTLTEEGICVMPGHGAFRSPAELDVDGIRIRAERFVIATGGTAAVPPINGIDGIEYLTNDTVFELSEPPQHLLIVGGGAIGCELAQALGRLAVKVTVVESEHRLLAREEPETSEVIASALQSERVTVRCATSVERVNGTAGGVSVRLSTGETVTCSHVLVATGRRPTTAGFGLEEIGVAVDERGFVVVDRHMATTVSGIYAAGDVTGRMPFTHAAARMAFVAAGNAVRRRPGLLARKFDTAAVPWATFTTPEVGRVGVTEAEAAEKGAARVAFLPLAEVDRGLITGETAGFVKLVAGPRPVLRRVAGGCLLGATSVAPSGGEMIHEAALAMRTKMFVGRLAQTTHAYPTWSIAVQQAALQFFFATNGREARRAATHKAGPVS